MRNGIGVDHHDPAPAPRRRRPAPRRRDAGGVQDARDLAAGLDRARPAARAASAKRWVTVPMPPSTIIQVPSEPGSRHMLWTRKFMPVPGVSQLPHKPGEAVGDGVHRLQQVALEVEALEVVADRAAAQIDEHLAQRRAHVALGGLLDRQRLLQPGRRDVVAQLRRSRSCSAWLARQSASEKNDRNCACIAAWSEPNSR